MASIEHLFDDLLESGRNWGVLIEPIIASYLVLPKGQREALRNRVSPNKRFALFSQLSGEFGRDLSQWDDRCLKDRLGELLVLLSIEDYQYDYRETVVRLKGSIDRAHSRLGWRETRRAWQDAKPLFSEDAIRRTEAQFRLWYPDNTI